MDFNSLIESILLEGKMDDFKDSYANHPLLSRNIIDSYHDALPEGHKSVANLKWMLDRHIDHGLHPRDSKKVGDAIAKFHHPEIKKNLERKQLSQYKTSGDLFNAIAPHEGILKNASDKSTVVYHSPTMTVKEHPDHESAIHAGKLPASNPHAADLNHKASWCVSADSEGGKDAFEHYTEGGEHKMHTIEVTHPDGHTRKYAVIHGASEYRDEHDKEFDRDEFATKHPEIMKTKLGHQIAGAGVRSLFDERGEIKPLHVAISNGAVWHHPERNNVDALKHIATNPEHYGAMEATLANRHIKENTHIEHPERIAALGEIAGHVATNPSKFLAPHVRDSIQYMNTEQTKALARNLPEDPERNSFHHPSVLNRFTMHNELHAHDIHELMTDDRVHNDVKAELIQHPRTSAETVDHVVNNPAKFDANTKFRAGFGDQISQHTIHSVVTDPHADEILRNGAVYNTRMGEHTKKWILDNAEKESGGSVTHFMNLAANKIRRENPLKESFESMVVRGLSRK